MKKKFDEVVEVIDEAAPPETNPSPGTVPPAKAESKPIEDWATAHATPDWLFAGTKLGMGWAIGQEVSEAEYLAAVKWAADVPSH